MKPSIICSGALPRLLLSGVVNSFMIYVSTAWTTGIPGMALLKSCVRVFTGGYVMAIVLSTLRPFLLRFSH